jgi:hypothetical protein
LRELLTKKRGLSSAMIASIDTQRFVASVAGVWRTTFPSPAWGEERRQRRYFGVGADRSTVFE